MANNVTLDSAIDKHLKPLKVGDKATSLEVSEENGVQITGDLRVTGKVNDLRASEVESVGTLALSADGGDMTLNASGDFIFSSATGQDIHFGDEVTINNGATGNTYIILRSILDNADLFKINTTTNGATTISTVDDGGTGANLTLDIDGAVDINSSASDSITLDAGTSIELDATSSGITTGILLKNAGTLIGDVTVHHAATFLRLYENGGASDDDHLSISCAANGATTIQTNDAGGTAAHINIIADGDITFNSTSGKFIAKNAGTEFSVANSAYAGMILGYTTVGIDAAEDSHALVAATMTVVDDAMKVKFVAPPSGAVEIFVSIYGDFARRSPVFGLSDQDTGDTYQAISFPNTQDVTNEHILRVPPSSGGDSMLRNYWVVTGLTAGTSYEWWFAAKTSIGSGGVLRWGGTATNKYPPFIMKATALPTATADYAVYG